MPRNIRGRLEKLEAVNGLDDYSHLSDAELIARTKRIARDLVSMGVNMPDWPIGEFLRSDYFDQYSKMIRLQFPDLMDCLERPH
ncbi:hypothetical protein A8B75_11590 [Sphingomonadales bacterium EhC05]|nr:hypothetical protein A8B75_11590 [Sphingomonadales bacterium EhC05]